MREYNADKFTARYVESVTFRTAVARWGELLERMPEGATMYLKWPASLWRKRINPRKLVWLGGLQNPDLYTGPEWFRFRWMSEFHGYQIVGNPQDGDPEIRDSVETQFKEINSNG